MKRRQFLGLIASALGTGFGGGVGAASLVSGRRTQDYTSAGDLCITPAPGIQPVSDRLPASLTLAGSRLPKTAFLDAIAGKLSARGQPVAVHGGGCDDAIAAVRGRRAHFGNLCCPVDGSPASGFQWLPIARDIKAVVVHPDNPLESISLGALRGIARGQIRNWKEVGGNDRPIALVVHDHCPTYFEPVRQLLLQGEAPWSGHRLSATTDEDHLRQIIRFSAAIGVNSLVLADPYVARGELKVLKVDGVAPGVVAAAAGEYPLTGPFNIIFSEWEEASMRPFLDYLFSNDGQAGIRERAVPVPRDRALAVGRAPSYAARA
ncbi:MAG: substrate-binding domain-containing protein [Thiohalomonadaceae bacterium]